MAEKTLNVRKLIKRAWHVEPEAVDEPSVLGPTATKFGGTPYAEQGDSWPICGGCDQRLAFVCQFNLAECGNDELGHKGLYAFYYCHACSSWGDLPAELKNAWQVRYYPAPAETKAVDLQGDSQEDGAAIPCRVVLSQIDNLPSWDEIGDIDVDMSNASAAANPEKPWAAYRAACEEVLGGEAEFSTQVGGYAVWVQSAETLTCPACRKAMVLLAQVDSEEEAGLMWGDAGSVYLLVCPAHPDAVQMRLQCF
jgi:uncharacterized protein YwqG